MPLTINVGLNRKISQNYNSEGYSINLTAELDHSLLNDPGLLQDQIDRLYAEAEVALDRQSGGPPNPHANASANAPSTSSRTSSRTPSDRTAHRAQEPASNGHPGRNTRSTSSGGSGGGGGGGMTQSQRRAVFAIAGKLGIDPADEAQHEFGLELDTMTLREASKLIDHLKGLQQGPAQGARR